MATSMIPVRLQQQSPAWLSWRAQGLGGSDAPIIACAAGLCKPAKWMQSKTSLLKLKTGRAVDFKGNWITRRGQRAEPLARAAFEKSTGILLSPMLGEMKEFRIIRSSFDGLDINGEVIGECKLESAESRSLAEQNQIPSYYKPQLAHQAMAAWGMPESWKPEHTIAFITHNLDNNQTNWIMKQAFVFRELAEALIKQEREFWSWVEQNREPY